MAYVPNSGNLASCMGEVLLGQMDPWYDQRKSSLYKLLKLFLLPLLMMGVESS